MTAQDSSQGTPRRDFLKTTAAGAAAIGGLSFARSAHAAGSDVIKVGMIGSGGRCTGAASSFLSSGKDVKLVAMCDLFEDRVKRSRNNLKNKYKEQVAVDDDHLFWDFDGYKKVIEESDVVQIACASKFHPMYAEAAIKAGKHVFVEKPHGIDPVGCRRMQAACDLAAEKKLSLLSGLQSRYTPGYQETVKRLKDGAIGDITSIQSMFLRGPYRLERRPEGMSETAYQFFNWYHFRWLSGDDVIQSLVHNMDRVSWILDEAKPESCFGMGGRSGSFGEVYGDMFDHGLAVYNYKDGPTVYAMCRTTVGCYNNSSDYIIGTKGKCNLGRCSIEGENAWRYRGPGGSGHHLEQLALADAIRKNEPINCGSYMAQSTMLVVLGQLAAFSGKNLTYDEVAKSDLQFGPSPEESTFKTPPPVTMDETGNYPIPLAGKPML